MNIYEELEWRGLAADCTEKDELVKRLGAAPMTLYAGFDPTADSLHVGSLVPLLALRRFQLQGHHAIAVAGGATGSIGDPSGKTQERQLLTREVLSANIASVKEQLRRLLDFDAKTNPARLMDNASWTAGVSYLDFLRDIGKHFSVNMMVAKESVRARMEDREAGISYTEFSYMLLQAFDFYHLCKENNCELQIGGSDQWGNITAGIDLIRKKLGKSAFGLTLPLITNADGSKFGKTVAGAVWLDPKRTSVYRFYQFWINADDRNVIQYLKYFTFLTREEIEALGKRHGENPGAREAHKALAKSVTDLIHGANATTEAIRASEILFGGDLQGISEGTFNDIVGEVPTKEIEKAKLDGAGVPVVELLVHAGLCPSKGQARKDVEGGGVYVNNIRESNFQRAVMMVDLLFGKHVLLRKGKKNYVVVTAK
ncbi:MAG TPA: tyrosine--tRNA ligase [Candidatus Acidoferrales bacterium]|jgi:tyrosyl-tRNA synthetase|nr:tyrosine--tRNA ligase [Candidatus Acidoferrales bacterium]